MAELFTTILNMSLTASIIILIVLLARLCLKKVPKIYSYLLWVVVLFRLLCPVSFSMPVSVLAPVSGASATAGTSYTASMEYISVPERPEPQHTQPPVQSDSPVQDEDNDTPIIPEQNAPAVVVEQQAERSAGEIALTIFGWVWAAGMVGVLGFTTCQTLALKRKLATACIIRGNIFESEEIDTAFILGVINPKIYLPLDLPFDIQKAVVAHEQTHQRRGDHIVKLVSYFTLAIHWFNPLVWLSFKLMCDDMEKSCDEAVIRTMNDRGYTIDSTKKAYGHMLLALDGGKQHIFSPVSFAENSTKSRVKNVVAYSRIARNTGVGLAAVCVLVALLCIVNPTGAAAVSVVTGTDAVVSASEEQENDTPAVEITIGDVTFMSDVTELDLSGQKVGDISALAQCTRLKTLNLSQTYIADISVLNRLPELRVLYLDYLSEVQDGNLIIYPSFDLSQLSEVTQLTELYLRHCYILDYSFIEPLDNLVILDLTESSSMPLSFLEGKSKLREFYCPEGASDEWTDESNFPSDLENLEVLILGPEYKVKNIARCHKLRHLEVYTQYADEIDFSGLTDLEYLHMPWMTTEQLHTIARVAQLKELYTENISAEAFEAICENRHLETLVLEYSCLITDISPIANLNKLKKLVIRDYNGDIGYGIRDGQVQDISALSTLTELQYLDLSCNVNLSDISPLSSAENLVYLNLQCCPVGDISALSELEKLEYLNLQCCPVGDISELSELKKLKYLNLNSCSVSDITALVSMEELTDVRLAGNNIYDVSCLLGHKGLSDGYYFDEDSEEYVGPGGHLELRDNPLKEEQLVELFESLKKQCRIEWDNLALF